MAFSQNSYNKGRGRFGGCHPLPHSSQATLPRPGSEQRKLEDLLIDSLPANPEVQKSYRPEITDVKYLASFNWLDTSAATVLVPGSSLPLI
jgi:hypothetical protein